MTNDAAAETPIHEHVTIDELRRFRTGGLAPDEIQRVARHLQACSACAGASRRTQDPTAVADAFREAVAVPDAAPRKRRVAVALAAAAAIAAAVVLTQVWPHGVAPEPLPAHNTVAQPPLAADYGNAEWNALVRTAIATGRLDRPDLRDLSRPGEPLRDIGGSSAAARLAPAGVVVETDRPRFSWTPVAGAADYVVLVYRGDREVARSPRLSDPSWTAGRPLERGGTVQWQVVATLSDGAARTIPAPSEPPALIRILPAAAEADLAEARRRFPGDPLLLGILYAHYGLLDEARQTLAGASSPEAQRLRDTFH